MACQYSDYHRGERHCFWNVRTLAFLGCLAGCLVDFLVVWGIIHLLLAMIAGCIAVGTFCCKVPRCLLIIASLSAFINAISHLFIVAIITEDLPDWHGACTMPDDTNTTSSDDCDCTWDYDFCIDMTRWFGVGAGLVWLLTCLLIYKIHCEDDEKDEGASAAAVAPEEGSSNHNKNEKDPKMAETASPEDLEKATTE